MNVLITSWQKNHERISNIRRTVFIEEQNVNEDEEWDDRDMLESTKHFLAIQDTTPQNPNIEVAIGTARILASGKIGRVAVLKTHRRQGIGKLLVRSAIKAALTMRCTNIYLDAQLSAMEMYAALGFVAEGDIFLDAGIEHKRMVLQLSQDNLSAIYGDARQDIHNIHDAQQHLIQQSSQAHKTINILTEHLRPQLYAAAEFVDAISKLARKSRHARIRILIKDPSMTSSTSHALIGLSQRLSSAIEVRVLTKSSRESRTEGTEHNYLICDKQHIVHFKHEEKAIGHANYHAMAEIKHLTNSFNYLWESHSEPDSNLRRLSL